jgi:hypothetical protein
MEVQFVSWWKSVKMLINARYNGSLEMLYGLWMDEGPEEKLSESKIFDEDWYYHNGDEVNGIWDHNFL